MQMILRELPYPCDALEPHISRATVELHHGKHHRAYVENAKALAKGVRLADQPLERIIEQTAGQDSHRALFNNAAQVWNHSFYWSSLRPGGGRTPHGEIASRIEFDLGGYESFATQFAAAATGQFGSGWAWLVLVDEKLRIMTTSNADTPLAHGHAPILTIDVWEHAYYLDRQNRRADYVAAVIGHLINWEFANRNLSRWGGRAGSALTTSHQIDTAKGARQ